MFGTWPVRLPAMKFTLSVRSFSAGYPTHVSLATRLPSVPTSLATTRTSEARSSTVHHGVMVFFSFQDFSLNVDCDFLGEVPLATAVSLPR